MEKQEVDLTTALMLLQRSGKMPTAVTGDPEFLQQVIDNLVEVCAIDPLTGMPNRRRMEEELERHRTLVVRGRKVSLLIIDIDGFKRVNDEFGHPAGDRVLKAASAAVRKGIRDSDLPARMGGEEFVVILPDTSIEHAAEVAERIRRIFSMEHLGDGIGPMTVSIGGAAMVVGESPLETLRRADSCLYAAKKNGRNRIVLDQNQNIVEEEPIAA